MNASSAAEPQPNRPRRHPPPRNRKKAQSRMRTRTKTRRKISAACGNFDGCSSPRPRVDCGVRAARRDIALHLRETDFLNGPAFLLLAHSEEALRSHRLTDGLFEAVAAAALPHRPTRRAEAVL